MMTKALNLVLSVMNGYKNKVPVNIIKNEIIIGKAIITCFVNILSSSNAFPSLLQLPFSPFIPVPMPLPFVLLPDPFLDPTWTFIRFRASEDLRSRGLFTCSLADMTAATICCKFYAGCNFVQK